jgi:hypothetical protein
MIATTISNSISEKPFCLLRINISPQRIPLVDSGIGVCTEKCTWLAFCQTGNISGFSELQSIENAG